MKNESKLFTIILWGFLLLLVGMGVHRFFSEEMDFTGSNVILITVDSIRPDHLSPYGYKRDTTPNLKKFAGDSSVFYYIYSQSSNPPAAMAGIFTAQTPLTHGVRSGARTIGTAGEGPANAYMVKGQPSLSGKFRTLTQNLSEIGYDTAGFSSSGFLTADKGFGRGFTLFDDSSCRWGTAHCVTEKALEWLGGAPKRPFFLWAHYNDLMDDSQLTGIHHQLKPGVENPFASEGDEADMAISRYDAKLLHLDREIGRLINKLKEDGLYHDSIIVLVGSNGESLGEHGVWGHGLNVYNEQIHVPLIIKLPRELYKGAIIQKKARQADVAPTIIEVVNAWPLKGTFGGSLVGDLQNVQSQTMEIYSECLTGGLKQAVIERKYKLIVHQDSGQREFYQIENDFREKKNIINEKQMDANRMYKRIKERFLSELQE